MRASFELRDRPSDPSNLQLTVTETSGGTASCEATLAGRLECGLILDCTEYFGPNTIVQVEGTFPVGRSHANLESRARVVYCRQIAPGAHRLGVEFLNPQIRLATP